MAELRDELQAGLGTAYSIVRELAPGGMSRVFLADETNLRRRVVVKVLPEELAHGVSTDRFRREIELAASLQHPNIVPVLTAGAIGSLPFYTMPFIEGESLRQRIAGGTQAPVNEAVRILREIARAPPIRQWTTVWISMRLAWLGMSCSPAQPRFHNAARSRCWPHISPKSHELSSTFVATFLSGCRVSSCSVWRRIRRATGERRRNSRGARRERDAERGRAFHADGPEQTGGSRRGRLDRGGRRRGGHEPSQCVAFYAFGAAEHCRAAAAQRDGRFER